MGSKKLIGTVRYFHTHLGFLECTNGELIFVHRNEVVDHRKLYQGQIVSFDVGEYQGRKTAVNVKVLVARFADMARLIEKHPELLES